MKTKNIFLTLALVLCTTFAFAQGTITGSAHDFGDGAGFDTDSWATGDEICNKCHTPHKALDLTANGFGAPLWDRAMTAATLVPYSDTNGTFDATDATAPVGTSKLCLSCHDGTVDLEAYAGVASAALTKLTGTASLGIDLSSHHPVSFTYDATLVGLDPGLHEPTTTLSGISLNIDDDMLFGTGNDQLECASCHDVHNNGPAAAGKLLVVANTRSALCLTCHNK